MNVLRTLDTSRTAERVVFALYLAAALFLVGRDVLTKVVASPAASASPPSAAGALSTRPSATAAAAASSSAATASVAPTPSAATPLATTTPAPSADPLTATAYLNGGRRFAALGAPVGYTLTSPIAGTATVVVYQFLGGDVRVGSNIPSEPFYPYVTITSSDRRVILRPGALDRDVQLLVKNGDRVAAGTPLLRVTGDGASSWRTFYDRTLTAQIVASVSAVPSGAELDPVPLFKR